LTPKKAGTRRRSGTGKLTELVLTRTLLLIWTKGGIKLDKKKQPVQLDEHRGMMAQVATEVRRWHVREFQAAQVALKMRQKELEDQLLAAPAGTWPEVATKAQYIIQLYAETQQAQDPRSKRLIAIVLDDLARLTDLEGDDG
jgi:hypothetical protein